MIPKREKMRSKLAAEKRKVCASASSKRTFLKSDLCASARAASINGAEISTPRTEPEIADTPSKLDCGFAAPAADIENAPADLNVGTVHGSASKGSDLLVNDRVSFEPATPRFSVPFLTLRCVRDNRCVKRHLHQLRPCQFAVRYPPAVSHSSKDISRDGSALVPCPVPH